ncbi:MFS transporter [Halosegnis rubeus]|uniref:MFS transporter n=1 Tax=Halosegnis rubeus TaxID=2212850 RepID=A0A5N5UFY8_9EURY|nr:MFS transporter [Halosegnis rubeus]KAB7515314.1 MFS transporter [Halosegnis rubeus]KAB7516368.1 MFS transporter [Halosegnis rubeus]KAB7517644.1 MFS transporter [Halosegnis rubeus]
MTTRSWRTVAVVAGWQAAVSLCYYALFSATTYFRGEFGLSRTLIGVLTAVATLGYTLNLFPSGAAVDGFGERRVMLVAVGVLAVSVALIGLAPTPLVLFAAAFLLGVSYAPGMPASNRAILSSAPSGKESSAMGLKQVGVTAGSGAASLLVAGVAAVATWRWGFGVIAVLAGGYALVFAVGYEGTSGSGEWTLPDVQSFGQNRAYVLVVLAGLFVGATIFTTVGYTLLYADELLGLSPVAAGIVLAAVQAAGSAGRLGAGSLADRLGGGARAAATVTGGQAVVATGAFTLLGVGAVPQSVALAALLVLGVSILGSTGVYYSCLTALVPRNEVGAASAGGQTAINVGGLLFPPAFGYLADTAGYAAGWLLLAGCAGLLVIVLAAVRRSVGRGV